MASNNQRIIFLVPENTTPAQIILDILKNNGITDPTDDIRDKNKTPRLIVINNAAKDFFDKKITEEKMSELFQKELRVSKESATRIINNIKEKLIPFGKKITVPPDEEQTESPNKFGVTDISKPPAGVEFTKDNIEPRTEKFNTPVAEKMKEPANVKSKTKKPMLSENPTPQPKRPSRPDNYREPI